MSQNLINTIKHLEVIASIKNPRTRNNVLREFSDRLAIYNAIREIAVNTIKTNVPLTPTQKRKLRRYKKVIVELSKPTKTKKRKQELIIQSGGALATLVPIIVSLLASKLLPK